MAIGVGQSTSSQNTSTATSKAMSFAGTPTVGSLIVVCLASWKAGAGGLWEAGDVTDNQGNSYSLADEETGDQGKSAMYYGVAATASGTFTVTATPSNTTFITMAIHEITGTATVSPLDGTPVSGNNTTANITSATITNTVADAILIGTMSHLESTLTITVGANMTQMQEIEDSISGQPINTLRRIVSSVSSYSALWTITSTTSPKTHVAAMFEQAAAGTKSIPPGLIRPRWRYVTRRVYI